MAAFVAKQMVGNKLNAVKGEFLYIGKFVFFWPSRISLIYNFLGQVINYQSRSFCNTELFNHRNAFYGIKETEKQIGELRRAIAT